MGILDNMKKKDDEKNKLTYCDTLLAAIVESSVDGIIGMSMDGTIVSWNSGAEKIYGYHQAEVIGEPISILAPPNIKDEVPILLAKISNGQHIQRFVTQRLTKNKKIISIALTISPIKDKKGQVIGASTICRAITEHEKLEAALKASEEIYKLIVENSLIGIFILQDGIVKFVNEVFVNNLGYTREELLSIDFLKLIHPDYVDIIREKIEKVLAGDISFLLKEYEIQSIKKNGDFTWVLFRPCLIDYQGKPAVLAYVIDFTEHKETKEKLEVLFKKENKQRKKLEEEAKIKNLFIDILAHELRTPLTAILPCSAMLQDMPDASDSIKKRLASNINSGAKVLSKLLDELLDLARYSKGTFKLDKQSFDIKSFLEEVADRYKPALTFVKQTLNLSIIGELPTIVADQTRLEQVIINLLSNASKYSPEKSNISLTARIKNKKLLLEVKDEGFGISKKDLNDIFQPYHRIGQTKHTPGTGLGLYVSKQIVKAHGGKIWVTSQPGKGSIFSVLIPLKNQTGYVPLSS
jgi:two-component system, chemotaxis family, CheB/CheR fusion protein